MIETKSITLKAYLSRRGKFWQKCNG